VLESRTSLGSVDLVLWFRVTAGIGVADGNTAVSGCVGDLSTTSVCGISVCSGFSLPLTKRADVFPELVSDAVRFSGVASSGWLKGGIVVSDSCVLKRTDVGVVTPVWISSVFCVVAPTPYDFILSAREDRVSGGDRTVVGLCSTDVECIDSNRSFIAYLAASTGDVALLRAADNTLSLEAEASPRRIAERDLADITRS